LALLESEWGDVCRVGEISTDRLFSLTSLSQVVYDLKKFLKLTWAALPTSYFLCILSLNIKAIGKLLL
jgi:hypothetical protein